MKLLLDNNRIEWVDVSKGIGILFVMYGHCYLDWKYCFWVYSFHMALFFFLSGYTLYTNGTNYIPFLTKKIRTILFPYVFFAAVTMAYDQLQALLHDKNYSITSVLLKYTLQQRYTVLWFMTCLFLGEQIIYALALLLSQENQLVWLLISTVSCTLFFVYREFVGIDLIWNADLAVLAVSFISLGVATRNAKNLRKVLKSKWAALISLLLSIICSWYNYKNFEVIDWYSNSFGNVLLFIIASISGVIAVVSFTINTSSANYIRSGLLYLGRKSLVFYGLHRIVIDMTFALYNKIGIEIIKGRLDTVLYAIISVIISLIVLAPVDMLINCYCPVIVGKRKS